MAHLSLNCPTCRKQLVYVPLDGLTLHYHCMSHGLFIFKPLVQLTGAAAHAADLDAHALDLDPADSSLAAHDAA